jgi:hypothetical protein
MRPGRDANHSSTSSAVVRNERGYTSSSSVLQNWHVTGDPYLLTRCSNPEDSLLHIRRRENIRSHPHTVLFLLKSWTA